MAYVNGKPIFMEQLTDLLLRGPGMTYARQLVRHEQVRQELREQGRPVSDADVEAEAERILQRMLPGAGSPKERLQVLEHLLTQKQVSRRQWERSIRMAAELRKLAEPRVEVTEQMLREEFWRIHGRQVIVRRIETENLEKAQTVLQKLKDGTDFSLVAWEHSISTTDGEGGLMPPISSKSEEVPEAIRQAALALKVEGEVSDLIQVGATFHVLRLEKTIEPKDVKFEDVRDEIEPLVREEQIRLAQRDILNELDRKAKVEYVHPVLKRLAVEGKSRD
jgi:foldase protein PrsA